MAGTSLFTCQHASLAICPEAVQQCALSTNKSAALGAAHTNSYACFLCLLPLHHLFSLFPPNRTSHRSQTVCVQVRVVCCWPLQVAQAGRVPGGHIPASHGRPRGAAAEPGVCMCVFVWVLINIKHYCKPLDRQTGQACMGMRICLCACLFDVQSGGLAHACCAGCVVCMRERALRWQLGFP